MFYHGESYTWCVVRHADGQLCPLFFKLQLHAMLKSTTCVLWCNFSLHRHAAHGVLDIAC